MVTNDREPNDHFLLIKKSIKKLLIYSYFSKVNANFIGILAPILVIFLTFQASMYFSRENMSKNRFQTWKNDQKWHQNPKKELFVPNFYKILIL